MHTIEYVKCTHGLNVTEWGMDSRYMHRPLTASTVESMNINTYIIYILYIIRNKYSAIYTLKLNCWCTEDVRKLITLCEVITLCKESTLNLRP